MQYDPHGEVLTSTLPVTLTDRLFTCQRLDSSTGLYYYNARYYDPHLGRFIQADTLVPDPLNPQAWNRFSYVYNNPATYIDPSGHDPVTLLLLCIAGGALAGEVLYAGHLYYIGEQANAADLVNWMAGGAFAGATLYMAPHLVGYGLSLAGMDAIGVAVWANRLGFSATSLYGLMSAGQSVYNTGYFLQCTGWAGVMGLAPLDPNAIGRAGEQAAGITGPKTRIDSLTGTAKYRVPDEIDDVVRALREVKNVAYLSNTSQLQDYTLWTQQEDNAFKLVVRHATKFSGPLQKVIDKGLITLEYLPW